MNVNLDNHNPNYLLASSTVQLVEPFARQHSKKKLLCLDRFWISERQDSCWVVHQYILY